MLLLTGFFLFLFSVLNLSSVEHHICGAEDGQTARRTVLLYFIMPSFGNSAVHISSLLRSEGFVPTPKMAGNAIQLETNILCLIYEL